MDSFTLFIYRITPKMKKVLVILFALMCSFAYSQQLSLHTSNRFGIGLNGDKTFSPEILFSAEIVTGKQNN